MAVRVADLRISYFVFQIHITDMYLELSWTLPVADMYFPRIGSRGVHLKCNKRVGCSAFFLLFS